VHSDDDDDDFVRSKETVLMGPEVRNNKTVTVARVIKTTASYTE
jgi:hypothetical protein